MQGKGKLLVRFHGKLDAAAPRIGGLAGDHGAVLEGGLAAEIHVSEDRALVFAPGILADGGDETRYVRRAAGAGIPVRALREHVLVFGQLAGNAGHNLKRIDVEEAAAVELHTAQDAVVQLFFENIRIFAVCLDLEHAAGKEGHGHGSARFGVDEIVRQLIVGGEGFAVYRGADTARDIHPAVNNVSPKSLAGGEHFLVSRLGGVVRHRGVEVGGAHGVADGLVLLLHGGVILRVLAIVRIHAEVRPAAVFSFFLEVARFRAALLEEIACGFQILLFAGETVQADERHLNFFVAGVAAALVLAEEGADEIGIFLHDVEQLRVSGGFGPRDGGLEHVTGAVELMALLQILPLVIRLLHGEIGVEVAVRLLRPSDESDEVKRLLFQLLVRVKGQRIGHGLQPLGNVAVLEDKAVEFARLLARGDPEVFDGVALLDARHGVFEHLFLEGDHNLAYQRLHLRPEGVGDLHAFDVDRGLLLFNHSAFSFFCFDHFYRRGTSQPFLSVILLWSASRGSSHAREWPFPRQLFRGRRAPTDRGPRRSPCRAQRAAGGSSFPLPRD